MKKVVIFSILFLSLRSFSFAQSTEVTNLLEKHTCYTCHSPTRKMVGPTWTDIAAKKYTKKRFVALVAKPEPKNWPNFSPMAALPKVPKADLEKIYDWVSTLK
jgi:cytochrome c551/c552